MYSKEVLSKAQTLFDYLNVRELQIERSDLIVGFGHFDFKIPQHCAKLYQEELAEKILFTGGRGAGSADFKEAESIEFQKMVPFIPGEDVIIERESTNTGENIFFSETVLRNRNPQFCFENGINKIIAVASPYRQKRVYLTFKKNYPDVQVFNSPPQTTFEEELNLFGNKNEDLVLLLLGELERIMLYPQKGYFDYEKIPLEIEKNYQQLKRICC